MTEEALRTALEREHREIDSGIEAFTAGTATGKYDDGEKPAAVVPTCQELLSLLNRHNSKDEPIIYYRADAALDGEANALLQELVVSGTTPEGWVCHRAGS